MHRWNTVFVALIALVAAVPVLVFSRALHAQPGAPAKPGGTWRSHACADCVYTMAVTPDAVWVGTFSAGLVRHDRRNGSLRHFTTADGLGGNGITEIAIGPDGDVWVATRASIFYSAPTGISRFDGQGWRTHDTASGLPDNRVSHLAPGANGTVWLATNAGIAHYDGQRWRAYTSADGLPTGYSAAVVQDGAGGAYVATDTGIAHFDGSQWLPVPTDGLALPSLYDMTLGDNGELWAVVNSGVAQYKPAGWPGGLRWEFTELGLATGDDGRLINGGIERDPAGRIWVIVGLDVRRLDGTGWTRVDAPARYAAQTIAWPSGVFVDPDGSLWISFTQSGVTHWDGATWTPLQTRVGPTNLVAFAITTDPRDQVWTGFFPLLDEDNLVNRFDGTRWARFGQADGVPMAPGPFGVIQNAIDADANDTVWVGIEGQGIAWYDGRRWASKSITDVVGAGTRIYSIDADDRGGVWAGTGLGAVHFDGRAWRVLTSGDGLPADIVRAIKVDHRAGTNLIWFGTDAGLTRWDGTTWNTYTTADGLAADRVHDIALNPRTSDLWLTHGPGSVGAGVTRFDGKRGQVFTKADGLAANGAWDIEVDTRGEVWVASSEDGEFPGISRFDGRQWFTYTTADGLIYDTPFDIAVDSRGTVWIATLAGISEFHPDRVPVPDPTPTPEPGPCVCALARDRVPSAAISAALADPASVAGWRQLRDPGKPAGPFNPPRECLSLHQSSIPYHPLYNGLEWHAGCP